MCKVLPHPAEQRAPASEQALILPVCAVCVCAYLAFFLDGLKRLFFIDKFGLHFFDLRSKSDGVFLQTLHSGFVLPDGTRVLGNTLRKLLDFRFCVLEVLHVVETRTCTG